MHETSNSERSHLNFKSAEIPFGRLSFFILNLFVFIPLFIGLMLFKSYYFDELNPIYRNRSIPIAFLLIAASTYWGKKLLIPAVVFLKNAAFSPIASGTIFRISDKGTIIGNNKFSEKDQVRLELTSNSVVFFVNGIKELEVPRFLIDIKKVPECLFQN